MLDGRAPAAQDPADDLGAMSASASFPAAGGAGATGSRAPVPEEVRGPPVEDRGIVRHDEVRAQQWRVRGISKVVHGVEVGSADLDGTVVVGGPLSADRLTAHGALEVRGPLTVEGALLVRGALEAGAFVRAGEATLDGPVRSAGEVVTEGRLRTRRSLQAPSVRGGSVELRGSVRIPGPVVATSFEADLSGDSSLGSVQCRTFRLRGPAPNVVRRTLGRDAVVTVERIEAETVRLEGARVGFVRAAEVVLGRNAHVGALEGKVSRAHPSSRVGPESWSRPPRGLSR